MSDKLMDTAPGGQSTQYESIKQFTNPPDKDVGQLGDPTNATKSATTSTSTSTHTNTGAEASLNKSAQGAGEALGSGSADEEAEQRVRREQGYGGERDMRRDVGA
ncbi:hypothetical protein IWX90DRAFT_429085 [Phyllosticta citrichinensis]|uniref:Uncharacterized protein n=1 Tax=Phyllosticta citrichinensis TaxID=1130410 RepID=A0ABR1Y113_9PEZI